MLAVVAAGGIASRLSLGNELRIPKKPHADKREPVEFRKQIQPLFAKHCYSCHGPKKQESGLRLDRKTDALAGGERGNAIVAGNAKKSLLYQYVAGLDPDIVMPPENGTLTKSQIDLIRRWIDDGADWPDK